MLLRWTCFSRKLGPRSPRVSSVASTKHIPNPLSKSKFSEKNETPTFSNRVCCLWIFLTATIMVWPLRGDLTSNPHFAKRLGQAFMSRLVGTPRTLPVFVFKGGDERWKGVPASYVLHTLHEVRESDLPHPSHLDRWRQCFLSFHFF